MKGYVYPDGVVVLGGNLRLSKDLLKGPMRVREFTYHFTSEIADMKTELEIKRALLHYADAQLSYSAALVHELVQESYSKGMQRLPRIEPESVDGALAKYRQAAWDVSKHTAEVKTAEAKEGNIDISTK